MKRRKGQLASGRTDLPLAGRQSGGPVFVRTCRFVRGIGQSEVMMIAMLVVSLRHGIELLAFAALGRGRRRRDGPDASPEFHHGRDRFS